MSSNSPSTPPLHSPAITITIITTVFIKQQVLEPVVVVVIVKVDWLISSLSYLLVASTGSNRLDELRIGCQRQLQEEDSKR